MNEVSVVVEQKEGMISFNFEEMKKFLEARLEEYRNAVFSYDSIKAAKAYTAKLRKEQTELKSRITEVKKHYMRPFDEFKEMADELVLLYDEPIQFIDVQIKDFEERRKAEKRTQISDIYDEVTNGIIDSIPLTKIYNPKWENATYKVTDIKKEISEVVDSFVSAINTITGMESDAGEKAVSMYRCDLNLSAAITYINNYERQKAEILIKEQEKARAEEQERIRREEREKIEAELAAQRKLEAFVEQAEKEKEAFVEQAVREIYETLIPELTGEASLYEYRMSLTADAKEKLEIYLDSIGVEWEMM